MKNPKDLFLSLFIALVLIGSAAAQEKSLTTIVQEKSLSTMSSGERYTSAEGGFTIALPKEPTKTRVIDEAEERGGSVTWILKEGAVVITFGEYLDGTSVKTAADRAIFFKGFRDELVKSDGVKLLSEVPVTVGSFRGASYTITLNGQKAQTRAIAWGNKHFSLSALPSSTVAGSEKLLFKALSSFRLAAPAAK